MELLYVLMIGLALRDPKKGELAATREWLSKNKEIKLIHYKDFGFSGRSFIVQIYS